MVFKPNLNSNFKEISPRLNQHDVENRKKKQMIAKAIEEKRNFEMKECSFRPKISTARSPSPKGALPPGYQETIARIRSAKVQKEE